MNEIVKAYQKALLGLTRVIVRADPNPPFDIVGVSFDSPCFHVIYRCATKREAEDLRDRVIPACWPKSVRQCEYGSRFDQYYMESQGGDVRVSVAWPK